MPKQVTEKKIGASIGAAITSTIVALIPVGIIALVAKKHPDVWSAPYPKYILYFLIANSFYSIIVGMFSSLHKIVWYILEGIAAVATLVLLLWAYISMNPLLLHTAAMALFVFVIYLTSDDGGDGIYLRYFLPGVSIITGLITVLWFIGAEASIVTHLIFASIPIIIYLIIVIRYVIRFFKEDGMSVIMGKELSYSRETEEEIRAKKEEKIRRRTEREEGKAAKRINERKRKPSIVGDVVRAFLPGTLGSKNWDGDMWASYIKRKLDIGSPHAFIDIYGSYLEYTGNVIEIGVTVRMISGHESWKSDHHDRIKSRFNRATRKCPYKVKLNINIY